MRVSHSTIKGWREWLDAGADPESLPQPQPSTLEGIADYLAVEGDIAANRRGLRVAADRLDALAAELRRESEGLPPQPETVRAPEGGAAPRMLAMLSALMERKEVRGRDPDAYKAALSAMDHLVPGMGDDEVASLWAQYRELAIAAGHYDPATAPRWTKSQLEDLGDLPELA